MEKQRSRITNVDGHCPFCGSRFVGETGAKGFGIVHDEAGCAPFEALEPEAYLAAVTGRIAERRRSEADRMARERGASL